MVKKNRSRNISTLWIENIKTSWFCSRDSLCQAIDTVIHILLLEERLSYPLRKKGTQSWISFVFKLCLSLEVVKILSKGVSATKLHACERSKSLIQKMYLLYSLQMKTKSLSKSSSFHREWKEMKTEFGPKQGRLRMRKTPGKKLPSRWSKSGQFLSTCFWATEVWTNYAILYLTEFSSWFLSLARRKCQTMSAFAYR